MSYQRLIFTLILSIAFILNVIGGNFTISGNIQGLDKTWVYLNFRPDNSNSNITDSAFATKGRFGFKGQIQTPTFATLYCSGLTSITNFIFDTGVTHITGKAGRSEQLHFKGSESTSLYSLYSLKADSFVAYRIGLDQYFGLKKRAMEDSVLYAQYRDMFDVSFNDEENSIASFIRGHKNSYVCAYLLFSKFSGDENINKGMALLNLLPANVQHSKYVIQFLDRFLAFQSKYTGMPASNFTQPDTSGNLISLDKFKGKYALVDFWASWCGPCRRENPDLVKIYQEFKNKGFEIISISLDENRENWINATRKDGLSWINVCDFKGWDNEALKLYGVSTLPANFLVDKNGVVIGKNLFGLGLEYELEKLFVK